MSSYFRNEIVPIGDDLINAVKTIIVGIGDDPTRSGLLETPQRVKRSYEELFSGYKYTDDDIKKCLKVFPDEIVEYDGMVVFKNIEFMSFCEHHLLPFSGHVHFGYIPKNREVVGASKIGRLIDIYSKRLQIQERLVQQIVDAFTKHINPDGCMAIIVAKHSCISCRGVKKLESEMITSYYTGCFEDINVKQEFMHLINI